MDKHQAQAIIRETFENPFDKSAFINFIKNFLNRVDEAKAFHVRGDVKQMFRNVIKTYERIGTYEEPDKGKIDVLVVYLQKGSSLDNARVTQRNFAGRYLVDRGEKDAGLFAFVSPEGSDWRFSLVKMDYKFEKTKSGRMKVKEEFTPARRWSFLVGENEKSHTAQSRLVDILANDQQDPTLEEIEKAFDIETVTKEFFLEYRALFIRTKEELDKVLRSDPKIKSDFEKKGVDTVNFAKKLLGQIVFLYFLQKKGWFGVGRDDDWGTGSKHFLRELFEKKHADYNDFFNDILEPLFYEALRSGKDREHEDYYYSRFNCKIPFLNGGLFDPIGANGGYDWVHTDIKLPDELFSNTVKTMEGDTGNGVLDVFDRYNFTVKEDEPLEKEVAIDPELLGKGYEKFNAIRPDNFQEYKKALKSGRKGEESKFNKKFGVYYTPREIVHYMCQKSLINYLATEVVEADCSPPVSKEDIEILIHTGEQVSENEARVLSKGKETKTYSYRLPESIRKNPKLIDDKLKEITVCDPAVGSGAFPVGMMSEIVKTRIVLSVFLNGKDRTIYDFKRRCIERSLYGVDIDPGAVEIAKLRLWLSLVVDEEDIKNIRPLPNLHYKIVCGDSLLGVERSLLNDRLFQELEKLKPRFFSETSPKKKQDYKGKIDTLISEISSGHSEFDFEVYFSEVFHRKGGFDVVIANPPYVRQEAIREQKSALKAEFGDFFASTADLFTYFYRKAFAVLNDTGHLCFISPNKFFRAGYGKNLRCDLSKSRTIRMLIDFGELPVFEAGTDPAIVLAGNYKSQGNSIVAAVIKEKDQIADVRATVQKLGFSIDQNELQVEGWAMQPKSTLRLLRKLKNTGMPLSRFVNGRFYRGVLTGFNAAFVIDEETRKTLIAENRNSARVIQPWLRGKDIKRWYPDWQKLYVIFARRGIDIGEHPAIKKHLQRFRADLEPKNKEGQKRGRKPGPYKWFEIQDNIAYYAEFEKPKLVYNETSKELHALYDESSFYVSKTGFVILCRWPKYLLGILNSRLLDYFYRHEFPAWGDPWAGGRIQFRGNRMGEIPILEGNASSREAIERLVTKALATKETDPAADVSEIEAEIDQLVYKLYALAPEEIKMVEG